MVTNSFAAHQIGWVAIGTGIAGLLGLAFIILFFTIGQPFGTLNDVCIGLAAILSAVLAWVSFPEFHALSPRLSWVALVAALAGTFVVAVGSALVISRVTGWYLAGLYMAAGNALLGLWLLGLNYAARHGNTWPQSLIVTGLVVGVLMALGLAAIPGIIGASIPGMPPPGTSTTSGKQAPWDGWSPILSGVSGWAASYCRNDAKKTRLTNSRMARAIRLFVKINR